jgi:L-rhamnonate dehydratase
VKIVEVEAIHLRLPQIKARSDSSQDALLIRITTDSGLVGWGEADSSPSVVKAIIDAPMSHRWASGLREVLIGEDPLEHERLWDKMYGATLYFGREGAAIQAMAGVDLALWDIKGKAHELPVCKLLGAQHREEIRVYASCLFRATPEDTAARALDAVHAGFSAVKFGWEPFGADLASDLRYLRAIRTALGPDVSLMVDVGFTWDAKTTLQRELAFREFDLTWIEEPIHPDHLEAYRAVCAASLTRIAAGEEECTLRGHGRLLEEGGIDVLQVDLTRCGLTQAMKIAELARQRGVPCVNHNFTTDLNTAASLHFLAAIPNAFILERCFDPSSLSASLIRNPIAVTDGVARVPQEPGLGVEPDLRVIEKYAVR